MDHQITNTSVDLVATQYLVTATEGSIRLNTSGKKGAVRVVTENFTVNAGGAQLDMIKNENGGYISIETLGPTSQIRIQTPTTGKVSTVLVNPKNLLNIFGAPTKAAFTRLDDNGVFLGKGNMLGPLTGGKVSITDDAVILQAGKTKFTISDSGVVIQCGPTKFELSSSGISETCAQTQRKLEASGHQLSAAETKMEASLQGVTIKGPMVSAQADAAAKIKGVLRNDQADAVSQVKGAIVQVN